MNEDQQDPDMMAEATGIKRVVDVLREVGDLDTLQSLMSNETSDAMAPNLQRWLIELIGQERTRRETGDEPNYSIVNPLEWPADELAATTIFSIASLECASQIQPPMPTVVQFTAMLAKVFVACQSSRLMAIDPSRSQDAA